MVRIAITGPESSGKSTLSESLSKHYSVSFISEFARTFLEETKGEYTKSDLDLIAKGQFQNISLAKGNPVICDTDFTVIEVWSEHKYGDVSEMIQNFVQQDLFDLHILCTPDIPWEKDVLRENPNDREDLFQMYKKSLLKHSKRFIVVSGGEKERIEKSIQSIDLLLKV